MRCGPTYGGNIRHYTGGRASITCAGFLLMPSENIACVTSWSVPGGVTAVPAVTNLGSYLHRTEAALKKLFPDIFGEHRVDYAVWFMHHAELEHCARRDLVLPVVMSWARGYIARQANGG